MYFKDIETSAVAKAAYDKRQKELSAERMKKIAARKK